jgi:hypothetical protein
MEIIMEVMDYMYGGDDGDEMDYGFEHWYYAFADFGYVLTEDIYNMFMEIPDPSYITEDQWFMLFDMFQSDNQEEILDIID